MADDTKHGPRQKEQRGAPGAHGVVSVEVFTDYVCPFCWLAEPVARELAEEPGVEVVWRAFELRPEPEPLLDPEGEYLRTTWERSVHPLAERVGMTLTLPPVQPRSRRAHEAARWARRQERFNDYHDALFRAFFEQGRDIGEMEVLVAIAEDLDLDGEVLREALLAARYEPIVLAEEQRARQLGLRGVPAFVADGVVALTGWHRIEDLRTLVAEARSRRRTGG